MNDTDRELLKMAAKAAGIELTWDCTDRFGEPWTVINRVVCAYWNPITDDGDALRLAVMLRLRIEPKTNHVYVVDGASLVIAENYNGAPLAATRRAIVRAAAEIGRNTK